MLAISFTLLDELTDEEAPLLLVAVTDLVWCLLMAVSGPVRIIGVMRMASGRLHRRRCCGLKVRGRSELGIHPTCVSSSGRIIPCLSIVVRLPTSACATSRPAPLAPFLMAFRIIWPAMLCLNVIIFHIMGWLQPDNIWYVPLGCEQMGQVIGPSI